MSRFLFEEIKKLDQPAELENGFYLWVFHADKIPPHVGCSLDGLYYSLKVNGKDESIIYSNVLKTIGIKKIPTLVIKLNLSVSTIKLKETYKRFDFAKTSKNTCLTPITAVLDCSDTVFQLSELLKYLSKSNNIDTVFGLNLNENYNGIPAYTLTDIESRLQKLENAKSTKNIS